MPGRTSRGERRLLRHCCACERWAPWLTVTNLVSMSEMRDLVAELRERLALVRQGGLESARLKHTDRCKLLVRDRVDRLLDPGARSSS